MPTKQIMLPCIDCGKQSVHIQQTPNHILHLLLSLVTFGIWVIVWILVSVAKDNATCTLCGTIYNHKAFKEGG